jgi:predicted RNase H-like HicB family nuclease
MDDTMVIYTSDQGFFLGQVPQLPSCYGSN